MLELLAASLKDGWAFVRTSDGAVLVKPPYRQANVSVVPEATVEKAVQAYGFAAMDRPFDDWESLIAFLRAELAEAHESIKALLPEPDAIYELLPHAPKEILSSYLDRIESELLPNREWQASLSLLSALIPLDAVKEDASLCKRTAELVRKCSNEVERAQAEKRALTGQILSELFPNATRRYAPDDLQEYIRTVSHRHQVFPVGAYA
jgi:hypothetical protein